MLAVKPISHQDFVFVRPPVNDVFKPELGEQLTVFFDAVESRQRPHGLGREVHPVQLQSATRHL